jgi:CRISPR-associated endonuclease/helicase Cas3
MTQIDFPSAFEGLTGHPPFPWQERLFNDHFMRGHVPAAVDLPTGLGKTSVMTVWYLALKVGASVPRRLVYVVDRRAVVDQATTIAEIIKSKSVDADLRLSTLRGQHLDNRECLGDPTVPAIIVGTVDMIGSRLLFSGYGISAKMRPYHAGFLGADTLAVLDEAHLVPPFEALLRTIARDPRNDLGARADEDRKIIPAFRLMALSATGREEKDAQAIFRLAEEDHKNDVVKQRLNAVKRLKLNEIEDHKGLVDELVNRAWALGSKPKPARVLVYCNSRDDALKVKREIDKRGRKEKIDHASELLVGERRVREREGLFDWLEKHDFIGRPKCEPHAPTFLIATSAGEVGIDLDADHMVCDLVEWERMIQRLGRVNRRGNNDASVQVIVPAPKEKKPSAEERDERRARLRKPIIALDGDASPGAIMALKDNESMKEVLEKAQTPTPLHPALTRALIDAWSMTSLEKHTGRPEIDPWLRGWVKDEPQTKIVWRTYLPTRANGVNVAKTEVNDFFEAAPPETSEILEAEAWRVANWVIARSVKTMESPKKTPAELALSADSVIAFVLDHKDELAGDPLTARKLASLKDEGKTKERERLSRSLIERTLVVSDRLGGLNGDGMLDENYDSEPFTIDSDDVWGLPRTFRVRTVSQGIANAEWEWKETYRFILEQSEDGEPLGWLAVEQHRGAAQSEEGRAIAPAPQLLNDHQSRVEQILAGWARKLKLPESYVRALQIAARLHDEGKQTLRWQRAFNAPPGGIYAKASGPINQRLLDGYRHEFGSIPLIERDAEFNALPVELQDLVLHLVAAHHGGARPLIATRSCDDAPPSALGARSREVALRFGRMQKRWGPWGLVWWEALLRAADQRASSESDVRAGEWVGAAKPWRDG